MQKTTNDGFGIVSAEVVEITPDMARSMLDRTHKNNRQISAFTAEGYLADMIEGKFNSMNGESIIVHEDGSLLDGQHRLSALVLSGMTMPFLVVTVCGDSDALLKTVDDGKRRAISDFLDCKNRTTVAGVANVAYAIERGSAPLRTSLMGVSHNVKNRNRRASRQDVVTYANEHLDEFSLVAQDAIAIKRNIGAGSPSCIGVALWLGRHYGNGSEYRNFIDDITSPTPTAPCITAVIGSIRKGFMNGQKLERDEIFIRILWAFDAFVEHKSRTRIDTSTTWRKYVDAVNQRRSLRDAKAAC